MDKNIHEEDTALFEMDACRDVIDKILVKREGIRDPYNFYEMYCYNIIPE